MTRARSLVFAALPIVGIGLTAAQSASALEPLEAFVRSSKDHAFDAREARATSEQRAEEGALSKWKLAPTLSGSLVYTRNQYEASVTLPGANGAPGRSAVITPQDQRDAFITVNVPLVDVGSWEKIGAANRTREAAEARTFATLRTVEGDVAKAYYQVIASEAVLTSANNALETQKKNQAYVETRKLAGFASELDAKRALSEVLRSQQDIAEAVYQVAIARRNLETLSGLTPSPGAPALTDDLHAEAPLAEWISVNDAVLPDVIAAAKEADAQQRTASATRAQLLPTLGISGTERFTNATGFAGASNFYQVLVTAQIKLDGGVVASARSFDAAAAAARAREDKTRRAATDRIFDAWSRVVSQADKARAARAQVDTTALAANLAKQRYDAGTATFLDLALAERDLFSAEVARIQADSDIVYARLDLRIAAGRAVTR